MREIAGEADLVACRGVKLQPVACDALNAMRTDAKKNDVNIVPVSGHRSVDRQREIFLHKLGTDFTHEQILAGEADDRIDEILTSSSIPGYSYHHSGLAVDFGCDELYSLTDAFRKTDCYEWLIENDFANARKHNFSPSYPDDGIARGPDPEPWEFYFVKD